MGRDGEAGLPRRSHDHPQGVGYPPRRPDGLPKRPSDSSKGSGGYPKRPLGPLRPSDPQGRPGEWKKGHCPLVEWDGEGRGDPSRV